MHSLRGRLALLFLLMTFAAVSAGALMYALFKQSASAQAAQAEAQLARACEAVADAAQTDAAVAAALAERPGVEGGQRRDGSVPLAYAFPTYQGGAPKTDEPAAERPRIDAANAAALASRRLVSQRFAAASQILLIDACPAPGPGLTAWTMTRVQTFAGPAYVALMGGLGVLLATLFAAAAILGRLVSTWSRHVGRIEATLGAHDVASLPRLGLTGEQELDRIVVALNDLGERLSTAKAESERLTSQLAAADRLAALGRISAGVAHEIRNPIAAMRLRAEMALSGDSRRQHLALETVIEQIDRLNGLVSRLLQGATQARPQSRQVELAPFLKACLRPCRAAAEAKRITVATRVEARFGEFDPDQMQDALVNLLENAIEAAPEGSTVQASVKTEGERLVFSVRNPGEGLPPQVRRSLFEPFVTTRAEGAGLGLAVVREIARAHRGEARLAEDGPQSVTFEIVLPTCRPS